MHLAKSVKGVLGFVLPALVLFGGVAAYSFIKSNPPEASKRPATKSRPVPVEATRLEPQSYTVALRSFGSVQPRRQTTLVAQVSGVVSEVSENFRTGAEFAKGDVLLTLEASDYEIAVRSVEASLVQARALYTEEKTKGEQAATDWRKLGKRGEPSALLLRTPQRQAALAQVQAAQAKLDQARLNLSRTQITAPYDGQVLETQVNQGRFVTTGSALGTIYSRAEFDVRLPLNSSQLSHIDLNRLKGEGVPVELMSGEGAPSMRARLVRNEGQIDPRTRQLFVVAEIEPQAQVSVGQFVEASLQGKTYSDVFVVPERLVLAEGEVLLVREGQVARVPVDTVYSNGSDAVVRNLKSGDVLILTPLGNAVSGMRVAAKVDGVEQPKSSGGGSGSPDEGVTKEPRGKKQ